MEREKVKREEGRKSGSENETMKVKESKQAYREANRESKKVIGKAKERVRRKFGETLEQEESKGRLFKIVKQTVKKVSEVAAYSWLERTRSKTSRPGQTATHFLSPEMETHLPVFWEGYPRDPRTWMAALLTLAGDIETNPGPPFKTTPQQTTYICSLCNKVINIRRQWSIECNSTPLGTQILHHNQHQRLSPTLDL